MESITLLVLHKGESVAREVYNFRFVTSAKPYILHMFPEVEYWRGRNYPANVDFVKLQSKYKSYFSNKKKRLPKIPDAGMDADWREYLRYLKKNKGKSFDNHMNVVYNDVHSGLWELIDIGAQYQKQGHIPFIYID